MPVSPSNFTTTSTAAQAVGISGEGPLPRLVQHPRQNRTVLRKEWARRITEAALLTAMIPEEISSEATAVAVSFVRERERVIRQQQETMRELPAPVLRVREQALICPSSVCSTAGAPARSPNNCCAPTAPTARKSW